MFTNNCRLSLVALHVCPNIHRTCLCVGVCALFSKLSLLKYKRPFRSIALNLYSVVSVPFQPFNINLSNISLSYFSKECVEYIYKYILAYGIYYIIHTYSYYPLLSLFDVSLLMSIFQEITPTLSKLVSPSLHSLCLLNTILRIFFLCKKEKTEKKI